MVSGGFDAGMADGGRSGELAVGVATSILSGSSSTLLSLAVSLSLGFWSLLSRSDAS